MIQAPQLQYMQAQQPMQANYQPSPYSPVQYNQQQTPGVFYNYPTASSYMPVQSYPTDKSQFNGVNIEIINPQGQGIAPNGGYQMPAQYMPVQQPIMIPQYQVPFPVSQAVVEAPPATMTQAPAAAPAAPAQQPVPAPVITNAPQAPQAEVAPQVVPQTPQAPQAPQAPQMPQDASITPESFAGKLNTNDLDAQRVAIEEIAETVKNNQTAGPVLLDTQVFDALVQIINKDTTALEGPSPEVIELRKKPQEQLTEEEKTKALTATPLENAEINKQYALYTISFMQERLNNELQQRNGQALELKDLPCIEEVITTAKSNPNPMLRMAALASLSHIARPEYKQDLTTIFELAKADEDKMVQDAATKALETLK